MKILKMRTISGPNVFHHRPVLSMILDLEEFTETASCDLEGFKERLVNLLPGLKKHRCSPGYEGGFIERLERGTYFAHIIEHVALELSDGAGISVGYGKSIYDGEEGRYRVVVRYKCEKGMTFLLRSAVDIVRNVAKGLPYNIDECLREAKKLISDSKLGPSTQAIIDAAERRHIPWVRLNEQNLIQLGYGKNRKFIQATTTSSTSDIAVDIAQDKYLTKKMLEKSFIKVPAGKVVSTPEEAMDFFQRGYERVAIKPLDGNHGRGITLDISDESEILKAFEMARSHSSQVLIEEFIKGNDYRLVFVGGKMVAASKRTPAHVRGNGELTVLELLEKENRNPLRGEDHEKPLTKIYMNEETARVLRRQGLNVHSIPSRDQTVFLKETANLSTGAWAVDVTDKVHPEIKAMCERAARIVGLDICGIDFIAEDISKPLEGQSAGLIEVNAGPGLRMHQHPSFGIPRDVGGAIIDNLFKDNNGRIPIIAITGTNGKTTVSRLLSHIFSTNGLCVGNTTSDGIFVGNELVSSGDTTGPASAEAVLSDPAVEIAVLETARGGIVKRGLAFDQCDVAVFTNVKADHIGQDGIQTVDDILKIKSLVVEQVRPGGTVILNADCLEVAALAKEEKMVKNKKVVFISIKEDNPILLNHVQKGGHGYFLRGTAVIEALGEYESIVAYTDDMPFTMNGTAEFHVFNAMAAIAAAHAQNVPDHKIIEALNSFSQHKNPGRTNLYKVGKGFLMMDFGHNPDAFTSIGSMARKWNVESITGVIAAPGDRSENMIKMSGLYAAYAFDKIIIREDEDLRGRKPGETADLLYTMINSERPKMDCRIIPDSRMALQQAIDEIKDNELVIFFYDDLHQTDDILKESRACPLVSPSLFKKTSKTSSTSTMREERQYAHYS